MKIGIGNSTYPYPPKYQLQFHANGQSPYLFIMDQMKQIHWDPSGGMVGSLRLEFGQQIRPFDEHFVDHLKQELTQFADECYQPVCAFVKDVTLDQFDKQKVKQRKVCGF